jgi:hypothetical protein
MPSSVHRSASQVPGEETLNGPNQSVTRGRNGREERFGRGLHVAVRQNFAVAVHDADVQAPGRQVDPAVKWVLRGVEAPEVSASLIRGVSQCQHTTGVCGGGGLNHYHSTAADAFQRPLRSRFQARLSASLRHLRSSPWLHRCRADVPVHQRPQLSKARGCAGCTCSG